MSILFTDPNCTEVPIGQQLRQVQCCVEDGSWSVCRDICHSTHPSHGCHPGSTDSAVTNQQSVQRFVAAILANNITCFFPLVHSICTTITTVTIAIEY